MRTLLKAALAAAALTALGAPAVQAGERLTGEAKLEKMLEGRVAGEPRRCIRTFGSRGMTVIDHTAIVYRDGRTLWVNRTSRPESIDDDDILIIRKFDASSLCRTDHITTADRFGGHFTGVIFLEDFVPYRKSDG